MTNEQKDSKCRNKCLRAQSDPAIEKVNLLYVKCLQCSLAPSVLLLTLSRCVSKFSGTSRRLLLPPSLLHLGRRCELRSCYLPKGVRSAPPSPGVNAARAFPPSPWLAFGCGAIVDSFGFSPVDFTHACFFVVHGSPAWTESAISCFKFTIE